MFRLQDLAAQIVHIQRLRSQLETAAIDAKVKEQLVRNVLETRGLLEDHLGPDAYAATYERMKVTLPRSRAGELWGAEADDA